MGERWGALYQHLEYWVNSPGHSRVARAHERDRLDREQWLRPAERRKRALESMVVGSSRPSEDVNGGSEPVPRVTAEPGAVQIG
jgi:hypothetical protein